MITIFCGEIRVGKTSLMTFLSTKNCQIFEKRQKMLYKCKELLKNGYDIQLTDYALYSDYNIIYDNFHGITIESVKINPERIGIDLFVKPFSTIAISEAQLYFNSRKFQSFTINQSRFFQTSGHYGIDIFLDCQDVDNIEKNIRNISTIIEVKKRTIFDRSNKITDFADERNFSKILWETVVYDNLTNYERRKGTKKQFVAYYNVFDTYNSFERFNDFLPPLNGKII